MTGTVFKYCDAYGVEILENLELKITPPNEFNDPFEFKPQVICSNPNRKIKNLFKDKAEVRRMYQSQLQNGFIGDYRKFKKAFRGFRPQLASTIASRLPEVNAAVQKDFPDEMSTKYGVLCMSTRRDSIVMWGHYCDKHRGLVVELDTSWKWFQGEKGLRPVQYSRDRVVWDTRWEDDTQRGKDFQEMLIFHKNDEWKYEDEVRQVFTLTYLNQKLLENNQRGYFLPIPPSIIKSVSLGAKCGVEMEQRVRNVLTKEYFSHVRLQRAFLHTSEFKVNFEDLNKRGEIKEK